MDKNISINEESVFEVEKSLVALVEEFYLMLNNVNKTLDTAETEGWNDIKFLKIKDDFSLAERLIKEGLSVIEDNILVEIRKIKMILEGY